MDVDLNAEQREFRQRVRDYMTDVMMTPDFAAELRDDRFNHGGGPI